MGDAPVHRLRAIRVVELGAHDVVMDADGEEVVVRVTIDTSGPVTVWHPDPDVFMQFLPRIKQSCEAVVNITTGGGHGMSLEERLAAARRAKPEMCSLNMGSMNFGLYPMLQRYQSWKHD